jgi:Co/Zn/Cd efflux system component
LDFDLPARRLIVYHTGEVSPVTSELTALGLGDELIESRTVNAVPAAEKEDERQRRVLWWILGINAAFFVLEMTFGLISGSMGLVADSLDMLADASVYALSLLVVGAATARKKRIAAISGYVQLGLAVFGFAEVVRRVFGSAEVPEFGTMIIVASLALVANTVCLWLLQRAKSEEAHMQASQIFTSNDIAINLGVILSGVLVYLLDSRWPDLVVGTIVFIIVLRGAVRILKLAK